jgi:polyferredoxin
MKKQLLRAAALGILLACAGLAFGHGPSHRTAGKPPAAPSVAVPADAGSSSMADHHATPRDEPASSAAEAQGANEHSAHGADHSPDHTAHDGGVGVAAHEMAAGDHGAHHHGAAENAVDDAMVMQHPGLPWTWILAAVIAMSAITAWNLLARRLSTAPAQSVNLVDLPVIGRIVRFLNASPYPLVAAKLTTVTIFFVVIAAGLFGTPYPERNLATVLIWNLWWPLVVVSVFFLGSAWCGICPWDALSSWIIRRRLWKRAHPHPGLNLKVPTMLSNVWLALLLFMGLTWLELGADVTAWPLATALMGLAMLALSLTFLFVFERNAFCRYGCPVGRTLGFYSRLAPVALRPKDQATCDRCDTLECFNGSAIIEPCPTHLTMGGLRQNTYCLSCGNCALSCPRQNVSWRLRPMGTEAKERARPQWDEAWFMLALLGITSFHGLTMMPFWDDWADFTARAIGETGHVLVSFTLNLIGGFAFPALIYAVAIWFARLGAGRDVSYRQLFAGFAFTALPLAFAYHLAHNLSHLSGETGDLLSVLLNPFGVGLEPLTAAEQHAQMMNPLLPDQLLFAMQAGLIVLGFWLAVRIARNRAFDLFAKDGTITAWRQLPLIAFICAITAINLWLMANNMVMRF